MGVSENSVPLNPLSLWNGYFIGNINPTFSVTNPCYPLSFPCHICIKHPPGSPVGWALPLRPPGIFKGENKQHYRWKKHGNWRGSAFLRGKPRRKCWKKTLRSVEQLGNISPKNQSLPLHRVFRSVPWKFGEGKLFGLSWVASGSCPYRNWLLLVGGKNMRSWRLDISPSRIVVFFKFL